MKSTQIPEPSIAEERALADWNPPLSWYFSRFYAREVARRILTMPTARTLALDATQKALSEPTLRGQHFYYTRWQDILEKEGIEGAVMVLAGLDDDMSQAMRTASPFSGWVIDGAERDELFASLSQRLQEFRTTEKASG